MEWSERLELATKKQDLYRNLIKALETEDEKQIKSASYKIQIMDAETTIVALEESKKSMLQDKEQQEKMAEGKVIFANEHSEGILKLANNPCLSVMSNYPRVQELLAELKQLEFGTQQYANVMFSLNEQLRIGYAANIAFANENHLKILTKARNPITKKRSNFQDVKGLLSRITKVKSGSMEWVNLILTLNKNLK